MTNTLTQAAVDELNRMNSIAAKYGLGTLIDGAYAAAGLALAHNDIFVGDAGNLPAAVAVSGDLTVADTGAFTIGAKKVTAAKIALADGKILLGTAPGAAAEVSLSGDLTVDDTGVIAIGAKKVVASMVAIANGKVLVGGAGGAAAEQTLSGDVTITNAGVATIAALAVTNAKVAAAAAIAFSKLAALADGNILVGSGATVPTSVAMSGDVTIINTGATTIGANKVAESMVKTQVDTELGVSRIAVGLFDPSAVAGSRTIAAHDCCTIAIPIKAIVKRAWYEVLTTFTSATDAATIALSIEGANDVKAAIAISNVANAWDAGLHDGLQDGTAAAMLKLTAARKIVATVAVEALLAGKARIYVEYVQGL